MKVIYCPVNGWDCPYWKKDGICSMYPEADPIKECDDFAYFWNEGDDYYDDTKDDEYYFEDDNHRDDTENDEYYFEDDDCGFDPYLGCYTDDC